MEFLILGENNVNEIEQILNIEKEVFGEGAIDIWNLKPYIKYGKVIISRDEKNIYSIIELMKIWGKNEAYMYGFSTNPKFQKKSYGQKLFDYAINYLKEEKIEKIYLTVSPKNVPAINFYKKNGFKIIKILENEYGLGNDRYYMELEV